MPHCFSKWCAAMLHLLGACVLLFPWAQVLLLLLQRFFLDSSVLDSVFAFCCNVFRSIGPAVPAASLFFGIVLQHWASLVLAFGFGPLLLVVRAYDCMFHSVSPYMTTSHEIRDIVPFRR